MVKRRILSTLQLESARDLEALDWGVRDLMQIRANVPCNAMLTAGYAIFKRKCLTRILQEEESGEAESEVSYTLGRGCSLHLHNSTVLFCFTSPILNLPEKEENLKRMED